MKTKIHPQSALVGLLTGVLVTVAIGAGVTSDRFGRYHVAGTDTHAVIIDTATGQAWATYFAPGTGRSPEFFEPKKN
jgi:hypothetical protein